MSGKLNYKEEQWQHLFMFLVILQHTNHAAHLLDPLLTSKPQAHHDQPAALCLAAF